MILNKQVFTHQLKDQHILSMSEDENLDVDLFPINWNITCYPGYINLVSQPEGAIEIGIALWNGNLEVFILNRDDPDGETIEVNENASGGLVLRNVNYHREKAKEKKANG